MKRQPPSFLVASTSAVILLALGYGWLGGARGWLEAAEAAFAAVAGVNHPVMFAEAGAAARWFNLAAIVAGLALRVWLFASMTVWLLRQRLELKKDARPPARRPAPRVYGVPRAAADWLEVRRN